MNSWLTLEIFCIYLVFVGALEVACDGRVDGSGGGVGGGVDSGFFFNYIDILATDTLLIYADKEHLRDHFTLIFNEV